MQDGNDEKKNMHKENIMNRNFYILWYLRIAGKCWRKNVIKYFFLISTNRIKEKGEKGNRRRKRWDKEWMKEKEENSTFLPKKKKILHIYDYDSQISRILASQDISPLKAYTLFHKHFKQYHVLQLWWSWTRIEHSSVPPERTVLYCLFLVIKIFKKNIFYLFYFFLQFSVESALLNRVHNIILTLDGAPISTNHINRSNQQDYVSV